MAAIFNFLPAFAQDFYAAKRRRDCAAVGEGLARFVPPYTTIRNRRGGYAVSIVKAGMTPVGRPAAPVRPPRVDLDRSEQAELNRLIAALGDASPPISFTATAGAR